MAIPEISTANSLTELNEVTKTKLQEIAIQVRKDDLKERIKLRVKSKKVGSSREIAKPKPKKSENHWDSAEEQEDEPKEKEEKSNSKMMLETLESLKRPEPETAEAQDPQEEPKSTISLSWLLDRLNLSLTFSLVDIPSDFDKCYYTHLYKSCELCHRRQAKNALTMCLICGALLCARSCGKPAGPGEMGNLSIHSLQYHCGSSAFLNTFTGQHILYELSRLYSFSNLYTNNFGLGVKEYKQSNPDFKTFLLDKNAVDKVKSDLLGMKNAEIIVNQNIISNEVFHANIF